jgi:hypothetical protein
LVVLPYFHVTNFSIYDACLSPRETGHFIYAFAIKTALKKIVASYQAVKAIPAATA